ncbi:aminoglycoside N(6')-acetyltransferase type 1 [Acrasis kona]|uniref:Aminoglycoside N(6')-acetyltransferase type 1 n=1 Tax=Acrasis kona TaxID=1008807 RepID=A0AAW2ZLN6_9EUKA
MEIETRFARLEDFDFVHTGRKEVFDIENVDGSYVYNEEFERNKIEEAIKSNRVLVAASKERLVGFIWFVLSSKCSFGVDYDDHSNVYAFIDFVFVSNEFRSCGVGRKLYTQMEIWCKENNIKEIVLDVMECNPKSMLFHEALGYKPFVRLYSKKIE